MLLHPANDSKAGTVPDGTVAAQPTDRAGLSTGTVSIGSDKDHVMA